MNEKHERSTTPTVNRRVPNQGQKRPANEKETPVATFSLAAGKATQSVVQQQDGGNVKVVCRFRPLNRKEIDMQAGSGIEYPDPQSVILKTTQHTDVGSGTHRFQFDRVFDSNSRQVDVYDFAAKPVVGSVLEGFNGTVFAYGQTSSGKTHTMQGPNIDDPDNRGIIPRMVLTVFDTISETPEYIEFTVKVSIVEIYMERIRDLLAPEKMNLKIRQDKQKGIYIEDVTESYVTEEKDIFDLMKLGNSNRAISATNMNEGSSRSHLIFMLSVHQNNNHEMSAKTGKLYLVDLAGSEKISKTGAQGQTLEEAKKINQSLSALGNVINALTEDKKKTHIPYRDSKLTRLLQESLGGNAKTTLIITCSPSMFNEAETMSTLRFGQRAKSVKNTPKINREYTVAELQLLLEKAESTITELKKRITQLELFIQKNGMQAPKLEIMSPAKISSSKDAKTDDEAQITKRSENGELASDDDEDDSTHKGSHIPSLRDMSNNDDLARIKVLESELESEKNNVRTQTEKLNILRKEFAFLNAKNITTEKENEALIHKLATATMKMQEIEEMTIEKDEEVEKLHSLKDTLLVEINELKNSKEQLVNLLNDKTEELDMLKKSKSGKGGVDYSPNKEEQKISITATIPGHHSENYSDLIKKLQNTFDVKDEGLLKKIISDYFRKKHLSFSTNDTSRTSLSDSPDNDVRSDMAKLKKDLQLEKERSRKIQAEADQLYKDYENIARTNTPNYDEIKKKIVQETVSKERAKYEKERAIILADLQTRVDKVVKLEIELDEEKERYRTFEERNSEGERALKKKVVTLENNLEQLTNMYHQLASQKSIWKVDNQLNENRLKRKTERIINLEKQLHETKELVTQYKSKIESLKTLISVTNSSTQPVSDFLHGNQENYDSTGDRTSYDNESRRVLRTGSEHTSVDISNPNLYGDANYLLKRTLSNALANPKIVKHIRGGSKRVSTGQKDPKALATTVKQITINNPTITLQNEAKSPNEGGEQA